MAKEGNKKRFRAIGWFNDWLNFRHWMRGNSKKTDCRNMAHVARQEEKRKLREELNSI